MSPIYKSGAFAQQCFASHRQTLAFKRLGLPSTVILDCTTCDMEHRLTVLRFTSPTSEATEQSGEHLARCVETHRAALRVSAMDIARDYVGLRCDDCHRSFDLDVATFETSRE